jgi:8-oxo-dGTP diphosphatase
VFFAGRISRAEIARIRFGDEGQYWRMMPVAAFISHPQAVPELQRRVRVALGDWAQAGAIADLAPECTD